MTRANKLIASGVIAALIVAGAIAIVLWMPRPAEVVEPIPGAAQYRFDESSPEVRRLMLSAVQGSADSATQLMEKYTKCHKMAWPTEEGYAKCLDSLRYWSHIALENGSLQAAILETATLMDSKRCVDAYRAEYWYDRFKEALHEDPVYLKSVAEEIAENKKSCTW